MSEALVVHLFPQVASAKRKGKQYVSKTYTNGFRKDKLPAVNFLLRGTHSKDKLLVDEVEGGSAKAHE